MFAAPVDAPPSGTSFPAATAAETGLEEETATAAADARLDPAAADAGEPTVVSPRKFGDVRTDSDLPRTLRHLQTVSTTIPTKNLTQAQFNVLAPPQRFLYRLNELLEYNATFGSMDVPMSYAYSSTTVSVADVEGAGNDDNNEEPRRLEELKRLANWVKTQRYERRLLEVGRPSYMTERKMGLLDEVGFVWDAGGTGSVGRVSGARGETRITGSEDGYADEEASREDDDSSELGSSAAADETSKAGILQGSAQEDPSVLTGVGISTKSVDEFAVKFAQLQEFVRDNGHARVPQSHPTLGVWVKNLRVRYRKIKRREEEEERRRREAAAAAAAAATASAAGSGSSLGSGSGAVPFGKALPSPLPEPMPVPVSMPMPPHPLIMSPPPPRPSRSSLTPERIRLLNSLNFVWAPSKTGQTAHGTAWDSRLDELREFESRHGHTNVPVKHEGGLGRWVQAQRTGWRARVKYGTSHLTEERVEALRGLGFEFEGGWKRRGGGSGERRSSGGGGGGGWGSAWGRRLEELGAYKEENGHANVPLSHGPLGNWVMVQRREYKNYVAASALASASSSSSSSSGEANKRSRSSMTPEKVEALEQLGFEFDRSASAKWWKNYRKLAAYHAEHGHCAVPSGYAEDLGLARWVKWQRRYYRMLERGEEDHQATMPPPMTMTAEMKDALDGLDFMLVGASASSDEGGDGGTTRASSTTAPSGPSSPRPMPARTIEGRNATWHSRLDDLRAFREREGHTLVPRKYEADPGLGNWVAEQRTQYRRLKDGPSNEGGERKRKSTLCPDRVRKLEEIGYVWDVRAQQKAETGQ